MTTHERMLSTTTMSRDFLSSRLISDTGFEDVDYLTERKSSLNKRMNVFYFLLYCTHIKLKIA